MAENKKSFILYEDFSHTFEALTDTEAGVLIKHIFQYVGDKNPITTDRIIQIAFEPIKQHLKRDLVKYESKREQWSDAGKKSVEAKKLKKDKDNILTKSTCVKTVKRPSTVLTVNVNDNVNVNDIINNNESLWNEHLKNFNNDFRSKEKFCKDNSISMPDLEIKRTEFIKMIDQTEDFKTYKELKSHFFHWFNKNKKAKTDYQQQYSAPPLRNANDINY